MGASEPAILIATYLKKNNRRVVLMDSNPKHIQNAKKLNLEAIECDIYSDDISEHIELNDVGYLMAITGSDAINKFAISKLKSDFGEEGAFRLVTSEEMKDPTKNIEQGLFSHTDDYINLSKVVRDYPYFHEVILNSKEHYIKLLEATKNEVMSTPLFLMDNNGEFQIISSDSEQMTVESGNKLMYLGKKLDV